MRMWKWLVIVLASVVTVGVGISEVFGQRGGVFRASRDHPAIAYSTGDVVNAVEALNQSILAGDVRLTFEGRSGYLRSVLDALEVPVESQVAVFSPTSNQDELIKLDSPRAIYFNDSVAVGWVRDAALLEVAAHDRQQGVVFYALPQQSEAAPQFGRNDRCLACHLSWDTLGVPGLQALSMAPLPDDPNAYASGFVSDHRSRLEDRWGGWYVTGSHGDTAHMGNVAVFNVEDPTATFGLVPPVIDSLDGQFDMDGYLSPYSDVVALMVLNHQTHMTNLITRIGWETRRIEFRDDGQSIDDPRFQDVLEEAAIEFVDYLLFIDEAPVPDDVSGMSGFAKMFSTQGPYDEQGRSLREVGLNGRLFRYPCSYMIYSEAFEALPVLAKNLIYKRMWQVLSGQLSEGPYSKYTRVERMSVVEILRQTKSDLPDYFLETVH